MIRVDIEEGDDAGFIARVDAIVQGIAAQHGPRELLLIKIDNWFGEKWLKFSGKILGAVGVPKAQITVPPFVPSRVVWERRFRLPSCAQITHSQPLHASMPSSRAIMRRLSDITPGVAIIWFSGRSEPNGQGAVMSYVPGPDDFWAWYAAWTRDGSWRVGKLGGISASEIKALTNK